MIELSKSNAEEEMKSFVYRWFRLFSEGNLTDAVRLIDEPNKHGIKWTEELIKETIEDFFGPDTRFAKMHPEGVLYSDPDSVPLPDCEIASLIAMDDCSGYYYDHDLPLNGEWSELTAQFEFKQRGSRFAVILRDLHVL